MSEEVKPGQLGASGPSQESNHYGLPEQTGQNEQSVESEPSGRSSQTDDEDTTASAPEEPMDKQAMAPLLERFPDLAQLDDLDNAQQVELLGKVLAGLQQDLNREGK
ncbi:hypothetical protein H3U93_00140 [Bifidobacterium sp. W8115]|uniref:hypothetical protein n=1 Tax=Bifidobacterium apousia TaxID=2750996 RepID=UPI0018DC4700|nr:hypothetical protein [Bifidobacterium apousia]MBI0070994.1 hypothetical protein [Bifidobacterium sp. W8112]MBI0123986.1 hypothetical protein [Bifidobacterium apousia]